MAAFGSRISGFFSSPTSGGGGGSVTSVGLSMPSAFTVGVPNPITTAGTFLVTGAGTTAQYVRGDGTLANFPTSLGGGASVSFYLNGSVNQGTFGGSTYYQLGTTPVIGTGTDFSRGTDGLIAQFITDANVPNQLNIPSGNWNLEFYFNASSSGGSPSYYVEIYKYDGATFTLIATNVANPELISSGVVVDAYYTSVAIPTTSLNLTDRIAIRIFVTTSGRTITLHTEDNNLCQVITTFTTGLTALNGLTAQVQTFATGTSGTDFGISSATSTHTFNLPTANATNRGALASADWSLFSNNWLLDAYQDLGSTFKSYPLTMPQGITSITTNSSLSATSARFVIIYIPLSATITGVKWYHVTQGVYTANNYNGVGLYTYSAGNLTLVASSTNDGDIWKAAANTWQTKAFTSPYVATAGIHVISALYCSSAQTTAPSIGSAQNSTNAAIMTNDFTNSAKISASLGSQNSLPASTAMSSLTANNTNLAFWLY